jgi:outer membrane PBP1 activator LpoA protein
MALLLPLSGAQAAVAAAVRDGFLAAYLGDARPNRPAITILDEERPGARAAYESAVAAGAGTVVGPLLKDSVMAVLPTAGAVPTLALNHVDAAVPTPGSFYQFALAPEDEARAVAERAAGEGLLRALALVPDNEWGRRMLTAFMPALEQRGGIVLGYRFYDPAATDFTAQIQRLLLLDESRRRHRALSAYLGVATEFEPRRRTDVDFIFLPANAAAGRLIRPQLRFLYAGDIPTYSTSAIYAAPSDGDSDLDGIRFTDAPALIGSDPRALALRAALERHWPGGAVGRMRFYAMGFDAYHLATGIGSSAFGDSFGLSGALSMDPARRIHRRMPWAEFRGGRIVALPELVEPLPDLTTAPP